VGRGKTENLAKNTGGEERVREEECTSQHLSRKNYGKQRQKLNRREVGNLKKRDKD